MSIFSSRENIVAEADKLEEEAYKKRKKAGVRRGYNRTFGVQIPSKNDIQRECNADLKYLNDKCVERGWEPIWEDPEEKEVPAGKRKQ